MPYVITEPCLGTKDKSCVDDKQLFIDPAVRFRSERNYGNLTVRE
jgi:hypothetical protein